MVYLTYEQYNKIISVINSLTDAAGQLTAVALVDLPVIGPIIGELIGTGLGKILAKGLKEVLYLIPHENEPRPKTHDLLPLYDPKHPPAVLPPNFKQLDDEEKIKQAIIGLKKSKLAQVPPAEPVQQVSWDYYVTTVPVYNDGKKYVPGVQIPNYYRITPLNPTFDHPGF